MADIDDQVPRREGSAQLGTGARTSSSPCCGTSCATRWCRSATTNDALDRKLLRAGSAWAWRWPPASSSGTRHDSKRAAPGWPKARADVVCRCCRRRRSRRSRKQILAGQRWELAAGAGRGGTTTTSGGQPGAACFKLYGYEAAGAQPGSAIHHGPAPAAAGSAAGTWGPAGRRRPSRGSRPPPARTTATRSGRRRRFIAHYRLRPAG
jgi:hypothetical protein